MKSVITLSDLNPHIRYARVHQTAFRVRKNISICYDCRLFFLENTTGSITVNNKKYELSNQTAVFLPPETCYRLHLHFQAQSRVTILDFDLTNANEHLKNSLGTATEHNFDKTLVPPYALPPELSSPIIRLVPQVAPMLAQCTDNFLLRNTFYLENSSALLKLCLLELARQNSGDNYNRLCENVLSYIHENYMRSTLSNQEIAAEFNYHPYHLSNIIRRETGKSLHQYLISYRLQIAKNFLLTTQHGISDIAWRCGFCSAAYFVKLFREHTGITPGEYRKLQVHTEL